MMANAFIGVFLFFTFVADEPAETPSLRFLNGTVATNVDDEILRLTFPFRDGMVITKDIHVANYLRFSFAGMTSPLEPYPRNKNQELEPFKEADPEHTRKRFFAIDRLLSTEIIQRKQEEYRTLRSKQVSEEIMNAKTHEEFAKRINELLDRLDVSHCMYVSNSEPAFYELKSIFARETDDVAPTIGAYLRRTQEGWFVVAPLSRRKLDREEDPLLVGDRIVDIEGEPVAFEKLQSRGGQLINVKVERAPGELHSVRRRVRLVSAEEPYVADMLATSKTMERDGVKVGYCRVWWMSRVEMYSALFAGLDRVSDADVVVLDLRGGWGGNPDPYLSLIGRGKSLTLCEQPIVVLVDEYTRSAKEWFAFHVKKQGRGVLVGHTTAGAMIAGKGVMIADDGLLVIPAADIKSEEGVIEGKGVEPDVDVPFDFRFAQGRDPQLERALQEAVLLHRKQSAIEAN